MKVQKRIFATLAVSALLLAGCGEDGPVPTSPSGSAGARRVAVTVTGSGYEPNRVTAERGESLTLVFTRTTDEGCGQELVIASQDVRRDLPLDEPVEVTFTPTEAGELRFTCGMDMYDGAIVVR